MLRLLVLCGCVSVGVVALPSQRPDLSGRWTFNAGQSDSVRDVAHMLDSTGAMSPPPRAGTGVAGGGGVPQPGGKFPGTVGGFPTPGGGGGGEGGGGLGGAPPRGGEGGEGGEGGREGGMSDEQRARQLETLSLALNAPAVLTLCETDTTITFATDRGGVLVLFNDGRKLKQQVEGGGEVEVRGHWQGSEFVVERKVSGGGKVTEKYRVAPNEKRLDVVLTLSGLKGRPITLRRVYYLTP